MANGWHRKRDTPAVRAREAQYATPEHKAQRRAVQALRDAGHAHCWRCGKHIPPGATVHAGHDDHDRTVYRGPECPPCNLKAAASKGARIRNARAKARKQPPRSTPLTW